MASSISPDLYAEQRYKEGKFYCDICGNPWPMSHLRVQKGGTRVGVVCCFEPEGDEVQRTLNRAFANVLAAQLSTEKPGKELRPPEGPNGEVYPGMRPYVNADFTEAGYVISISPATPIVLVRGGAAVAVTLTGNDFTAADSIVYANAGITNNVAPVLVSATEWDLSVQASNGMATGLYGLTFNSSIWQAVFDVR